VTALDTEIRKSSNTFEGDNNMLNLVATFHVFSSALKQRITTVYREDRERGSVSVEQVVITLALLIAAAAAVGIITNVIGNKAGEIGDAGA